MSSHREAPQISKDPVADSTDVYAFVSPDNHRNVTLIANYIPFQLPDGGPNFYEFGADVTYDINIDNTGTGTPNITYRFNFSAPTSNATSYLYNTGPITSLNDSTWMRKQTYTLTRLEYSDATYTDVNTTPTSSTVYGPFTVPPCNIGPLSTPDYGRLAGSAIGVFDVPNGQQAKVFAGQRSDPFYVDLGAVFDLGIIRPLEADHATFGLRGTGLGKMEASINSLSGLNVNSLVLEVPQSDVAAGGVTPANRYADNATIGVWTCASRPASRVYGGPTSNAGAYTTSGALEQVSRLANPLVNELLIPMASKDSWNASLPKADGGYAANFKTPALASLLPVLYPGVFKKLAAYNASSSGSSTGRPDIEAIFLTGIPATLPAAAGGTYPVIPEFHNALAQTGVTAEMMRLNMGVRHFGKQSNLGVLGGDYTGFPNGRRIFDDVVSIELLALAGATLPLVAKATGVSFTPDKAVSKGVLNQYLTSGPTDRRAKNTEGYILRSFPYVAQPHSGFKVGPSRLASGVS